MKPRPLRLTAFPPVMGGLQIACSCRQFSVAKVPRLAKGVSPQTWARGHFKRLGWHVSSRRRVEDRCPSCVAWRSATAFRCDRLAA